MESGLEDRNNVIISPTVLRRVAVSQWSPA